jgi:neutral ceramidase
VRVGHGSALLPVADGSAMGGYVDRPGPSSGVLDELQVDCVTVRGAGGRLVLVVAEVVCVNVDLAAEVRRRVREALAGAVGPVVDVWACATHTHSGPDVGCVAGGGPTPVAWRRRIADAAVEAARAAVAAERECAGRLHAGELRDVGSRRGHERAEHRVSVDVVSCVDADGAVEGVLAVVPVHPTVLPAGSTLVSGDLAAAIRAALRRRLTSPHAPWVVVATGAAGDISTRRTRRAQTPQECRRLGEQAAEQIVTLMRTAPTNVWDAAADDCSSRRRTVALPVRRQDPADLQALRETLEERHAAQLRDGATASARSLETALQGVEVARSHDGWAGLDAIDVSLSAARLGRLCLFGIGAEPFHGLGDDLRSRCADPAVTLGYVNGHVGYLPDADAYSEPAYEVLSSPLPRDAAATTVASLLDLLPDPTPRRTE